MVSLFAEKSNEQATLELYNTIQSLGLAKNVDISINNTLEAKSGLLYEDGKLIDISLANCYTLEDMIRELIKLMGEYAVPKE